MNLVSTKSYSVESIWTIIDDYMWEINPEETKKLEERGERIAPAMKRAERAMDMINSLMKQGFTEMEAWEITSEEIVYI